MSLDQALAEGANFVSGFVYPGTVTVVSSREPKFPTIGKTPPLKTVEMCCGTHLNNTSCLGNFVITSVKVIVN